MLHSYNMLELGLKPRFTGSKFVYWIIFLVKNNNNNNFIIITVSKEKVCAKMGADFINFADIYMCIC